MWDFPKSCEQMRLDKLQDLATHRLPAADQSIALSLDLPIFAHDLHELIGSDLKLNLQLFREPLHNVEETLPTSPP